MIYAEAKAKLENQIVYIDYIDWDRMTIVIDGKTIELKVDWEV